MSVYLVNILLICFWGFALVLFKPTDRKKKVYCTIVAMQWILISGLRHISVGADTYAYYYAFERVKSTPWKTILLQNWDYLFHGLEIKDPGYPLLEKIFQIFCGDYQVFLLFIAAVFTISMAVWIYKNSAMPCLSFLIYSVLFYAFYAVTGHRQTLATALIVFVGYKYIKEKKLLKFLVIAFIAFMLHKSSLVFIPYYFIAHIRITKPYVITMSGIIALIVLLGKRVYGPIALFMGFSEEQVEYSIGGSETYALILTLVCFVVLAVFPFIRKRRKDANLLCNITFLTLMSSLLIFQNQGFMRIQQYYSLFIMITIPEVLLSLRKEERTLAYAATVIVLIAYLIKCHPYYRFFFMA